MVIRRRWHAAVRAGCALAAMAVPLLAVPAPVHAWEDVQSCSGPTTWTYGAELGTVAVGPATVTTSYTLVCGGVIGWDDLSAGEFVNSYYNSPSYTYSGNCALANLAGTGVGLLVGGAVAVRATAPGLQEVDVMAPLDPCLETRSTGAATVLTSDGL